MRLLIKPSPILGESWPGYLLRLSASNRYEGIQGIADILKMSSTALVASSAPEILLRLGIEAPANAGASNARMGKRPSLYAAGRSLRARVCARCLGSMEEPHIKSCWDRPFVFSCPSHNILLLEACPACNLPITNLRGKVAACDCGYMFERAKGQAIDFDISQMLTALNLQTAYALPAATFASFGEQELKAFILIHRLNQLNDGTRKSVRMPIARVAFLQLDALRRALCWFESWPENFIRLTFFAQPRLGRPIGNLIFGESLRGSEDFPAIREALNELDQRRRDAPRPKRGQQVAANDHSEFVGIRFVMDATGSTYDVVKYWISKGWLGDVTVTLMKGGQSEYKISKSFVGKAIHNIRSTGSVREFSKTIGLSGPALRVLARNGVLQSLPYGKGYWNVRLVPAEVYALSDQLLSASSRGVASEERRILIDQAILLLEKLFPELIKPLIAALVHKKLPLRFFGDPPTSPGELTLKLVDFQAWRKSMRAQNRAS